MNRASFAVPLAAAGLLATTSAALSEASTLGAILGPDEAARSAVAAAAPGGVAQLWWERAADAGAQHPPALDVVPGDGIEVEYTRDFLSEIAAPALDDEGACLAEAIYYEARGEPVRGQFAVAEVILNRVEDGQFPDTICEVVNQGTGRLNACQFSYTCDGIPERMAERPAARRAEAIAHLTMRRIAPNDLTQGALYYHADYVDPYWADSFFETAKIGVHIFYNPEADFAEAT
ncbi:MAG: cell wall hydrolase [Hasllibacter sp.]